MRYVQLDSAELQSGSELNAARCQGSQWQVPAEVTVMDAELSAPRRPAPRPRLRLAVGLSLVIGMLAVTWMTIAPSARADVATERGTVVASAAAAGSIADQVPATAQLAAFTETPDGHRAGEVCSAMLVGPRAILTARHCLLKESRDPSAGSHDYVEVSLGAYTNQAGALVRPNGTCTVPASHWRYAMATGSANDYAVIGLINCDVGEIQPARLAARMQLGPGTAVSILGHPGDQQTRDPLHPNLWLLPTQVLPTSGAELASFVDTDGGVAGGASGSPLMTQTAAGAWVVVGVVVQDFSRADRDELLRPIALGSTRSVRVSDELLRQVATWSRELRGRNAVQRPGK